MFTSNSVIDPGIREMCPACGSTRWRDYIAIRDYRFRDCRQCRTLFCADPPSVEVTMEVYADETYFQNPDFESAESGGYHGYKNYLRDRGHIERKFGEVVAVIERFVEPGRLLDVGAGPGFLLSAARSRGWKTVGVDVNPWAAAYAGTELGIDVRPQTLGDAAFPSGSLDAVTMMDVIEHISPPGDMIAEAARIIRPGGILTLLTPDGGSPVSRLMRGRWPDIQRVPEHLVLFSVKGIAELVQPHGFEVLGWHWIGKTTNLATLAADVSPAIPAVGRRVADWLSDRPIGGRVVSFDPLTKFVLYARRLPEGTRTSTNRPRRFARMSSNNGIHQID